MYLSQIVVAYCRERETGEYLELESLERIDLIPLARAQVESWNLDDQRGKKQFYTILYGAVLV